MIKRFCNRCGRIYDADNGGTCNCKASQTARAEQAKAYDTGGRYKRTRGFYQSPRWRKLAERIRNRDGGVDRLQAYLFILVQQNTLYTHFTGKELETARRLAEILITPDGLPRRTQEANDLTVHHIVPREDDRTLELVTTNLISVDSYTHTVIHDLYRENTATKEAVQGILHDAVDFR